MCGLVAIYKNTEQSMRAQVLEEMTNTLVHRGPDDFGFAFAGSESIAAWRDEGPTVLTGKGVAFGHRRLSIIDLSSSGRQPFTDHEQQLWVVFNGEIFNYLELRKELESLGCRFHTNTDTEVLFYAFQHWGAQSFNKLNGMWAAVFRDNHAKQLTACRDRFGIKPLFYSRVNDDWVFASEIKAILAHPQCTPRPDQSSMFHFLYDCFKPQPGVTFFEEIQELEPGHYLTIKNGHMEKHRYWYFPRSRHTSASFVDNVEELRCLVDDSVRLRLRSDVGVGTMLSGGIDSTSIISTVSKFLSSDSKARQALGDRLQGFHASYPGLGIDEKSNVDLICDVLNLEANYVYPMQEQNIENLCETAIRHMEAPFHNSVPMVSTLLMRKAKAKGLTVMLAGHGADELLAGYPHEYAHLALHDMLSQFHWVDAYRHINGYHLNYRASRSEFIKEAMKLSVLKPFNGKDQAWIDPFFRSDATGFNGKTREKTTLMNKLDHRLKHDFSQRILPNWLHMEDKISMANSIEARLPFLDYRLVEFAFSLKPTAKMQRGLSKYILRRAMSDRLPRQISDDTRKVRFAGPGKYWLKNSLQESLVQLLSPADARVGQFLNQKALKEQLESFLGNESAPCPPLIWRAFNAELWYRTFIG